jgi:hypothetical protein
MQVTNCLQNGHSKTDKYYDRAAAMRMLLDDVILHIKAFDGDLFGGVVRDYKMIGSPFVRDVNCRIDGIMLNIFISTLNLHFKVKELPTIFNGYFVDFSKRIQVSPKYNTNNTAKVFTILDIVILSRPEWMRLPCDFDVNCLAENSISSFVRPSYFSMNKFVDKYNYVQKRIKTGKFGLLDLHTERTADQIRHTIDKAMLLVLRDWTMDDLVVGNDSWVINYWSMFNSLAKECRTCIDDKGCEMLRQQTECSLCGENYKHNDVVINTKCNHNFHWTQERNSQTNVNNATSPSHCKGLREWVKLGNVTCPICRDNMF